jgi:UrcA family protein
MKSLVSQRSALIGLALASTGLACGLARAEPPSPQFETVVVRYSDLDLDKQNGAEALYRRIKIAARQACGAAAIEDLAVFARYRECYGAAVANAVTAVKSTRVSELYRDEAQHVNRT